MLLFVVRDILSLDEWITSINNASVLLQSLFSLNLFTQTFRMIVVVLLEEFQVVILVEVFDVVVCRIIIFVVIFTIGENGSI